MGGWVGRSVGRSVGRCYVMVINKSYNIDFFLTTRSFENFNFYWYSGQAVFDSLACSIVYHCFVLLFCFTTVCLSFIAGRNKMI